MTDPRTATQELQTQVLDSIRKSQEAALEALKTWAEAAHSVTPALPISAVLLAAQRKFAEDVIQITAPVAGGEAPASAAKKTAAAK
jgi:hypothetical protein